LKAKAREGNFDGTKLAFIMSIMKKSIFVLIVFFGFLISVAPSLDARTVSFGDSAIYWPGHPAANSVDVWFIDNNTDYIGEPDLKGGNILLNSGLTQVNIEGYGYVYNGQTLSPGDLFISTGLNPGKWDFVVPLNIQDIMLASGNGGGTYDVYRLTSGIPVDGGAEFYRITGLDFVSPWGEWDDLRNDHPYALAAGYLNGSNSQVWGTATFSGVQDGLTTWQFSQALPYTGDSITVGWTISCANDVIYEKVNVPEPTILLLLGAGLIGVLGARRKMRA
jgi:hypothetical protein